MTSDVGSFGFSPVDDEIRTKWGWFVVLGIALLLLGLFAFANVLAATVASVFVVGALMIVGAVAQIVEAFQVKRWSSFFYWLLGGVLYGIAGVLAFVNPLLAAAALTLVLAVSLVVSGILRILVAFRVRPHSGWGWLMTSGVITTLAGVIFAVGWPANTLWLLGIVLAVDLAIQGATAIGFGLALKGARVPVP